MNKAALKAMLTALVAASLVIAPVFPAQAAGSGERHHRDTADYCLRASDVYLNLSELQGLGTSEKEALARSLSGYAFYEWAIYGRAWGSSVSGSDSLSGVDWERAGTYTVTVSFPSLSEGTESSISYSLTIIDDLPEEPVKPPVHTLQVRYVDFETGLDLISPWVLTDLEEGSVYDAREALELLPQNYEVRETEGDLEGLIEEDLEIRLILIKKETEEEKDPTESDPAEKDPAEKDPAETDPAEKDPEEKDPAGKEPEESSQSGASSKDKESGSGKTKTDGKKNQGEKKKTSSNGTGKKSSGSSSGTSGKKQEAAAESAQESSPAAEEKDLAEETAKTSEEDPAEVPDKAEQEAAETEVASADSLTTESEKELAPRREEARTGQEETLVQEAALPAAAKEPGRGLMALAVGTLGVEASVLFALLAMILSDLRIIRWFESKRKR